MATPHPFHKDSGPAQHGHLAPLRFVVLPLAVFALANLIFSLSAFDLDRLVGKLLDLIQSGQAPMNPFVEARARLAWATTVLLLYATLIAVSVFSVSILRQSLSRKQLTAFAIAGVLLCVAVLGHMAYSGRYRTEYSYIFFFTFDSLEASQGYSATQLLGIKALVAGINVMVGLVAILALITGCCIMSGGYGGVETEAEAVAARMSRLKMFIGIVSVLLVAGVLHTIAWLRWPTALIADEQAGRLVTDFSETMGMYWGATFSLLIATFYIPAAWSLAKQAEAIITAQPHQTQGMDRQDWLQKHSLSLSPLQQLPQLFAILAPLLAGPVGGTLARLPGPLGGG